MSQARWAPKRREVLGFGEVQLVKGLCLDSQHLCKAGHSGVSLCNHRCQGRGGLGGCSELIATIRDATIGDLLGSVRDSASQN